MGSLYDSFRPTRFFGEMGKEKKLKSDSTGALSVQSFKSVGLGGVLDWN